MSPAHSATGTPQHWISVLTETAAKLWKRRAVLAGGALAVVAWIKGAPYLLSLRGTALEFRDLQGLQPFRELLAPGVVTASQPVFAGISDGSDRSAEFEDQKRLVRLDPCRALFGDLVEGPVPVAVFSDFRCPNCRVMEDRLSEIQAEDPDAIRIVRHELPILGAASVTASRAVLAADLQGAYRDMHARLTRTPAVTDMGYIAEIAAEIGLDRDRLLADMQSPAITRHLSNSKAIADVFSFIGTPAFAVGRTVFMGAISKPLFRAVISAEDGMPCTTAPE
jgi:protein-disulfide isomerase